MVHLTWLHESIARRVLTLPHPFLLTVCIRSHVNSPGMLRLCHWTACLSPWYFRNRNDVSRPLLNQLLLLLIDHSYWWALQCIYLVGHVDRSLMCYCRHARLLRHCSLERYNLERLHSPLIVLKSSDFPDLLVNRILIIVYRLSETIAEIIW